MKKYIIMALILIPSVSFGSIEQNLKYGMTGTDVSQLQELLVSEGCLSVSPTGYFGLLTLGGVKCFQEKHGISPVSGYFGILSRGVANSIIGQAIGDSDRAEQSETGSVSLGSCAPGDLFDINTGKACSKDAETTDKIEKTVDRIEKKIDKDASSDDEDEEEDGDEPEETASWKVKTNKTVDVSHPSDDEEVTYYIYDITVTGLSKDQDVEVEYDPEPYQTASDGSDLDCKTADNCTYATTVIFMTDEQVRATISVDGEEKDIDL